MCKANGIFKDNSLDCKCTLDDYDYHYIVGMIIKKF